MANLAFNRGKLGILNSARDLVVDVLQISLHTSAYVADADHNFLNQCTNEATVLVSGLSGLSVGSHKEAFVQGDDVLGDHTALDHQLLAVSARLSCEYVSATEMNIVCHLLFGLATGQFTVHWTTL